MTKLKQCDFCGRIELTSGVWVWDDGLQPSVVGLCPICESSKQREKRDGVDPFKGMAETSWTYGLKGE